ncbi:hypothetical protein EYF80_020817 [Liparis tanakae]|uniref:Uncharacterized protein n=1 Tax=Liparis tanakae TaxID=230148 RepID=A0A4Z2HSX1_9TELE|nr:hypothetical protein EYF80_020817 [Liparis tanakae]
MNERRKCSLTKPAVDVQLGPLGVDLGADGEQVLRHGGQHRSDSEASRETTSLTPPVERPVAPATRHPERPELFSESNDLPPSASGLYSRRWFGGSRDGSLSSPRDEILKVRSPRHPRIITSVSCTGAPCMNYLPHVVNLRSAPHSSDPDSTSGSYGRLRCRDTRRSGTVDATAGQKETIYG